MTVVAGTGIRGKAEMQAREVLEAEQVADECAGNVLDTNAEVKEQRRVKMRNSERDIVSLPWRRPLALKTLTSIIEEICQSLWSAVYVSLPHLLLTTIPQSPATFSCSLEKRNWHSGGLWTMAKLPHTGCEKGRV